MRCRCLVVSAGLHAVPQSHVSGALGWQQSKGLSVGERYQSHPPQEVPPLQALTVGRLQSWPERGGGPDVPAVPQGAARPLIPSLGNYVGLPIDPTLAAVVLHHRLQASVALKNHG